MNIRSEGFNRLWWSKKRGFSTTFNATGPIALGTYERLNGEWRVRVKRRTGGHTWRWLKPDDPMIKKLRVIMLICNIS